MSYYVAAGRREVLGVSTGTTALLSAGSNAIVPGSGPIVAVSVGVLDNLFGGGGRDAARQARVNWFEQAARQGSPLAARFLVGGTQNTSGNERPMFTAAIQRLLADPRSAPTMRAAQAAGPWWDTTDNATSDRSRAAVEDELEAYGTVVPASAVPTSSAPSSSSAAHMLPGMTTTAAAPFNWKPWAFGAAAAGLGLLVLPKIIRPSRSR